MDAELGRQPERREDPRDIGQSADDRLFLRAHQALFVACHRHPSPVVRVATPSMPQRARRRRPVRSARRQDADVEPACRRSRGAPRTSASNGDVCSIMQRPVGVVGLLGHACPAIRSRGSGRSGRRTARCRVTFDRVELVVSDDGRPGRRGVARADPASPRAGRRGRRRSAGSRPRAAAPGSRARGSRRAS